MDSDERIAIWDEIAMLSYQNSCTMRARRTRDVEEMGLTSSQMDVILYLLKHEQDAIYQVDLERAFHLSNPTVTGLLKRLEAKGFIARDMGIKDKRCKRITPTDRAREVRERICLKRDEANACMFGDFTDEELHTYLRLMRKANENIMKGKKQHD